MNKIVLNNQEYEVIKNYKDALDVEVIENKITDYFKDFDYILGDYAYGKVRLKGFNNKSNKNYKPINAYERIDEYIKNFCAYDCKHFILKRIEKEFEKCD